MCPHKCLHSEGEQLRAFGEFCRRRGLDRFLRARDWTRFALGYNGPAQADNDYDAKLAAAYRGRRGAVVSGAAGNTAETAAATPAELLNRRELAQLR